MSDPIVEQEVETITEPWDDLDDQTFYSNVKTDDDVIPSLRTNSNPMDDVYIYDISSKLMDENVFIDSNEILTEHENDVQHINTSDVSLQEQLMGIKDIVKRETKQRESSKKMRKNDRIKSEPKIGFSKNINQRFIPSTSTRVSTGESRKAQPTSACEEDEKVMEEQIVSVTDSLSQSTIPCKKCSFYSSCREDLNNHMVQCHGHNLLECCNCDFTSVYKRSLKDHEKHHSQIEYFKCKYCEFSTDNILKFENHELSHTELKEFPCDECHFRTNYKSNLRKHKMIHSGDMPFLCSYCDYKTVCRSRIQSHELIHTGKRPYACPHCNFSCNKNGSLKNHIRRHTGEKPYKCHLCSFKAISKDSLNVHLKKHNSSKGEKYICSVCEQIYFYKTKFLNHEKSHEKEAALGGYMKPITNKKRKADYLAEKALSSSISTVPPKQEKKRPRTSSSSTRKSKKSEEVVGDISTSPIVKLYICSKCSYICRTFNELSDHMSSHKKSEDTRFSLVITKEYRCTPCNLSFSSRREEKHHLMEKHIKKKKK